MRGLKFLSLLIMMGLITGCNVTPDFVADSLNSNSEYPSKARFKREQQQRQDKIDARFEEDGVSLFFSSLLSTNNEYPSKQRFAQQGVLKDAMLMQELRERKVGANHHIPELMQVAVTTDNDPRWVPIVGFKRTHPSYSEPIVSNPRFVALRGPK